MNISSLYILIGITLFICSCSSKEAPQRVVERNKKEGSITERLSNANKVVSRNEETMINQYIARRNWPMRKMNTGVRIWEYEKGKGSLIDYNDEVTIAYKLEAINGVVIYDSQKTFAVGKGDVEVGLDEAVRQLKEGSKAKIIIPSHLGYGLIGDGEKIPKLTILFYDITILNKTP